MIVKRGKRYGVRVTRDGKQVWVGTFQRERDARKAERAAYEEPPKGPTCDRFVSEWLSQDCPRMSGRKLKSDTLYEYRTRLKPFVKDFKDVPLRDVTREKAFKWALENRSCVQFVRAVFSHARDLGLVDGNPFEKLHLAGSSGRKHKVPLTEPELHAVADKALEMGKYGPQFRAFVLFLAYTGIRPGEAMALRWENVDLKNGTVQVVSRVGRTGTEDLPKSNVTREVLLPPPAAEALLSFPRSIDLVFRGKRGQQLRKSSVKDYWGEVRPPGVDLYELRHFCGHHLYVRLGLPARVVAKQLGHRDGGRLVVGLYGHGEVGAMDELRRAWGMSVANESQTPGIADSRA